MIYYPEGINDELCKTFGNMDEVRLAMQNGDIIEGRVLLCDSEHNLHLDLGIIRGIIPRLEGALEISEANRKDIALISRVNKRVAFKIVALRRDDQGMEYAVLSRRIVQLEAMRDYISKLKQGDIIGAKVTHLESFGAFIDIGVGINSLIPIDMLSVSRISSPAERVGVNQIIRCVLKKQEPNKLTFSLKELLGTWEENCAKFAVGETVTGIVRSIESYGVFVELAPNLAGLAEPCDSLEVGQSVSVFIKSIIPDKMKIKLVIVEAFDEKAGLMPLKYYISDEHISYWRYSPENAKKLIETSL